MDSNNKQLVLRFYEEVWNRGNYDFCDEVFAPTGDRYDAGKKGMNTPALQKEVARRFRENFPDAHMEVELIVAEGDLVAARWRMSATHKATGRKIANYTAVNFWRFADGRVIEVRNNRDDLGLFHQLGLVPAPEALWVRVGPSSEQ